MRDENPHQQLSHPSCQETVSHSIALPAMLKDATHQKFFLKEFPFGQDRDRLQSRELERHFAKMRCEETGNLLPKAAGLKFSSWIISSLHNDKQPESIRF